MTKSLPSLGTSAVDVSWRWSASRRLLSVRAEILCSSFGFDPGRCRDPGRVSGCVSPRSHRGADGAGGRRPAQAQELRGARGAAEHKRSRRKSLKRRRQLPKIPSGAGARSSQPPPRADPAQRTGRLGQRARPQGATALQAFPLRSALRPHPPHLQAQQCHGEVDDSYLISKTSILGCSENFMLSRHLGGKSAAATYSKPLCPCSACLDADLGEVVRIGHFRGYEELEALVVGPVISRLCRSMAQCCAPIPSWMHC